MLTLLLGTFSVALLSLACLVIKRRRINLVWELERYLGLQEYKNLVKPVRAINRAFTPIEKTKRECKFIGEWIRKEKEIDGVYQREIYLLEEKDALDAARRDGLSPDEKTALLGKIEEDLGQIKPQLWKKEQDMNEIDSRLEDGSWVLEFLLSSEDEEWERGKDDCLDGLGCCARGCGCCKKDRKHPGQALGAIPPSHCTIDCGCCIRWRGFRHPEDSK